MKILITESQLFVLLKEQHGEEYKAWVTPNNEIIKVSSHESYMKQHFENSRQNSYDDAFRNNWVRIIVVQHGEIGGIEVDAINDERIINMFKVRYRHLLLKNPFIISIETHVPKSHKFFNTTNIVGKNKFLGYINQSTPNLLESQLSIENPAGRKQIMKDLHLKLIRIENGVKIYLVDGELVRDKFDIEFTMSGHHWRYQFIPINEIWIDNKLDKDDIESSIEHEVKERSLMKNKKMNFSDAYTDASKSEKIFRSKNKMDDDNLSKDKNIRLKLIRIEGGVKIYLVDGELVRDKICIDYTMGGHHYRYPFIPENEVWIDNEMDRDDIEATIKHEMHERTLMKGKNMGYDKAHSRSSNIEKNYRKKHGMVDDNIRNDQK